MNEATVIRWNPMKSKWLVLVAGAPVASATRLDILQRHFPDAEVIAPDAA